MARRDEIRLGPALIYSTIDHRGVRPFSCEIVKLSEQSIPGQKGIIIHITDPELLGKTGGIVQGMSGSPIVQDGKLVGAVTHVFINDPLQGYGVLAEWMVYEAGLAAAGATGDRTGERAAAAGFQPFSDELSGGGVACWQGAFASSSPTTT